VLTTKRVCCRKDQAKRLFQNFSDRLVGGGLLVGTIPNKEELITRLQAATATTFGNSLFSVTFPKDFDKQSFPEFGCRYSFFLDDAVSECEEYVVSKESFVRLASEVGLDLVEWTPFEEFKTVHQPQFADLFTRMKAGLAEKSQNDWEVVTLYSSNSRILAGKLGIESNKIVNYN
jgi:mRNA (guanine-N7-)-methyltransferase